MEGQGEGEEEREQLAKEELKLRRARTSWATKQEEVNGTLAPPLFSLELRGREAAVRSAASLVALIVRKRSIDFLIFSHLLSSSLLIFSPHLLSSSSFSVLYCFFRRFFPSFKTSICLSNRLVLYILYTTFHSLESKDVDQKRKRERERRSAKALKEVLVGAEEAERTGLFGGPIL